MKRIKVTSKTGQELFLGMPHSLLEYWHGRILTLYLTQSVAS